MNYKCIFCQIRSFERLLEKHKVDESAKNRIVKEFLSYLASIEENKTAPQVSRDIQAKMRKALNNPDPYKEEKHESNQFLLGLYDEFWQKVQRAENKFDTALRMAIASNIIDFGPGSEFDVMQSIDQVLSMPFAIDHSAALQKKIEQSKTVLYLGDNAGEIVLDKLFIEYLSHPNLYFAVRGNPVLNDATLHDAAQVGIGKVAKVISNGYDAPSTVLDKSAPAFVELFNSADLIISKGMGNFEGLLNHSRPNLFFLFMVKCQLIGDLIGVKKGEFVVKENGKER